MGTLLSARTTTSSNQSTDHVCKGRDEEEEDGADAHYGAVSARLDDSLGHRLEGGWEELENRRQHAVVTPLLKLLS